MVIKLDVRKFLQGRPSLMTRDLFAVDIAFLFLLLVCVTNIRTECCSWCCCCCCSSRVMSACVLKRT